MKCKYLLLVVALVLRIAVFLPFSKTFDYTFGGEAGVGDIVLVKFGKFEVYGVVCEVIPAGEYSPSGKFELKPIKNMVVSGLASPVLLGFLQKAAAYNIGLLGMFFKLVFPFTKYVPAALRKAEKRDFLVRLGEGAVEGSLRGKYWKNVWGILRERSGLLSELGLLKVQTELLVEKGLITLENIEESAVQPSVMSLPELSAEQVDVLRHILPHLSAGFNVFLIDGETGSGKTEVYFHLIAEVLESSPKQVLLMLPEIALSSVILGRFEERFGFVPILWHSGVTDAKRQRNYEEILNGNARVVIGTRSSLFLPYKNLGLVIVDEEHDGSYKQDEMTCYHGRDMAVLRAKMEGVPVVLGSATPSLESYNNAMLGKYRRLALKSRFFGFKMPVMQVVDMRKTGPRKNQFISQSVRVKMMEVLAAGGQVMLFLNRRGYAPIAVCTACGFKVKCKNCDVFMTEHRFEAKLKCHHCGYVRDLPEVCLECGAGECFSVIGVGVERIMEELGTFAADYKAELLTSDTLASPVKTAMVLERIQRGDVRIIVGTQVVSKGYHFANLRFVAILDADFGLNMEDFRAFEKTFQLLYQVAGRSGRESADSSVYIQTYEPQNQVLASIASYDKEKFYELEVETRRKFGLPPFSKQVGFVISGEDREATLAFARTFGIALGAEFGGIQGVSIFGPTPAILSFLRQRYRFRLLLLSTKVPRVEEKIAKTAAKVVELEKNSNKIMLKVDVDPVNFY